MKCMIVLRVDTTNITHVYKVSLASVPFSMNMVSYSKEGLNETTRANVAQLSSEEKGYPFMLP